MNDMIKKIIDTNKDGLEKRKSEVFVEMFKKQILDLPRATDFYGAFKEFGIIAEIKLASPSAGKLADADQIMEIANDYRAGGADAISVITEKYFFDGDIKFINQVKEETGLPVLQKDFVVDDYQIYEAKANGADALLLIAKIVSANELKKLVKLCLRVGVEPVVEINDQEDLEKALETNTKIIAVNARDLDTFKVDVNRACELLNSIPYEFLKLGFSGVNSKEEVAKYNMAGAQGVLVGTKLMKATDKRKFIESLKSLKSDRLLDSRLRGNDMEGSR